jgi:hypothetical protein
MERKSFAVITALIVFVACVGCKKQEQCAAGDTPQVCKAFQDCLKSDTSTEVCRMGEQDAQGPRSSPAAQQPKH